MKAIELFQTISGLTPLHIICWLLGTFAYVLDKYLEQFNKSKLEGKAFPFSDFIKDPNTSISGLLTLILSFVITIGIVNEIPDHDILTAIGGFGMSYGGYAFLRQRMKSYQYSKQFKVNSENQDQNEPGE